ncbi:MAG: cytochrome c [Thermoanaerobaculum sp.]|nr:cytochrome c [Thermoanaerobaculum sp.]MDW7966567.1 cytochrome c [Thermoanaerobaculum sp.]
MPKALTYTLVILAALALIPLALIARARVTTSSVPRLHLIGDMDTQPYLKAQAANPLFADGRAMRMPVPGTVARGSLMEPEVATGRDGNGWLEVIPVPLTRELMARGRERYDIFCAPCHGYSGYGDGVVNRRAERLQEGTWTPVASFHTETARSRPAGYIYNAITHGVRTMPPYGGQIPVLDRWAIVAYVKALQRSQHASLADVPPEVRMELQARMQGHDGTR